MSHPLALDVLQGDGRPQWAAWLLLAVALAFAADTARSYSDLRKDTTAKQARLARALVHAEAPRKAAAPVDARAMKFAHETITCLAMPWDELFRALEMAKTDQVTLVEIDPDPSNGIVAISGEARDYLSLLTYVGRLGDQPQLQSVRLARHEELGSQKGYAFTISANWRGYQ